MFTKARLTLTGWYVLIIMLISILFSAAVYRGASLELERNLRRQVFRIAPSNLPPVYRPELPEFENQIFEESKRHLIYELILVNFGILAASAISAYFLAGKTLKPIELMMDEQKRFVADASHELRTPLTAMKTEIEVALRDKTLNLKESKEMLVSNLEEVNKMQLLSNSLLTLSRYQDTTIRHVFTTTSLAPLIKSAIDKLQIIGKTKDIEIALSGKDVQAEVDAASITELVNILIDNAIKYNRQGGKIEVKLASDHRFALITVKDTGLGIKATDLPYIFNRFYRADSSRNKNRIDGYGLGLSIAKRITDLHQGRIWAASTIDAGTEFSVKLPIRHNQNII